MKKITQKWNILIFCLFLGILSVANLAAPKQEFSEYENRTLAEFPDSRTIRSGEFDDQFENWFSDHFIGRSTWIEIQAALQIGSGALENNDVYFADDSRLIRAFQTIQPEALEHNIETVQQFLADNQIQATILLAPTAAWGQRQSLKAGSWNIDEEELLQQIACQFPDQTFIDLGAQMDGEEDLYYHTDHHWNARGARLAYEEICRQTLHREPEEFHYETVSEDFGGTMLSRSGVFWNPRDQVEQIEPEHPVQVRVEFEDGSTADSLYFPEHLDEKDEYPYYVDGNHAEVHITTSNHNGRKALIIKDSFAHILIPYLAQEYEELEIIDLRQYHDPVSDLLQENQDVYFIYSLDNFCSDNNIAFLR